MNAEDISKCLQRTGSLQFMTKNRKGRVLEDLIVIQSIIENRQLNKLLLMQNDKGKTMLHYLMKYSEDPEDVTAVLQYVEGVMEGELFKQFLLQKDNKGRFSIIYADLRRMKDILVFMRRHFSNQYITIMFYENKVRLGKSIRDTDCALVEILYLEEILGSEMFKEILISKDENGWTRLHYMMFMENSDKLFVSDLKVYASFLDNDSMGAFLFSQDKYGNTFLHFSAEYYLGSQYTDIILRELHSFFSSDSFENLINVRNDDNGVTFIHYFKSPISELSFLDEFLGKKKFIDLVTAKDKDGMTRLHYINHDNDVLCNDLMFYSELLNKSSFRDFILTKNKNGETFYSSIIPKSDLEEKETVNKLEGILSSILSPDLFLELQEAVKMLIRL